VIVGDYLFRTLPHVARRIARGDIAHLEGRYHPILRTLTLLTCKLTASRVVYSPHNTFSRSSSSLDDFLWRLELQLVDAVVVFSSQDAKRVVEVRGTVVQSPLIQIAPVVEAYVREWRTSWRADSRRVVLFAGQIRPDKRLDLAVEAVALLPEQVVLVVIGEDRDGEAGRCRALAAACDIDVRWHLGFAPLARFVSAIAAADVVVCPYDRASQSGILSVAAAVGTPSVATSVGGLSEQATFLAAPGDARALADAIRNALSASVVRRDGTTAEAVSAHLRAYGLHGR
jgi:glycosyltransferase involved in cell wall biosynthesis